jgi:hypothetical protein
MWPHPGAAQANVLYTFADAAQAPVVKIHAGAAHTSVMHTRQDAVMARVSKRSEAKSLIMLFS